MRGDGTVWCWGSNVAGQIGHDPAGNPSCPELDGAACSLPAPVTGFHGSTINSAGAVSVGLFFACYVTLTSDQSVWCWGSDAEGTLGIDQVNGIPNPTPSAQFTGPQRGVSANNFACANGIDGGVSCWGPAVDLDLGEAGATATAATCLGTPCASVPVPLTGLSNVVSISVGGTSGIALRDDGSVWAWGSNLWGMLGHTPGPAAGDVDCSMLGSTYCNGTPSRVLGLP